MWQRHPLDHSKLATVTVSDARHENYCRIATWWDTYDPVDVTEWLAGRGVVTAEAESVIPWDFIEAIISLHIQAPFTPPRGFQLEAVHRLFRAHDAEVRLSVAQTCRQL